MTNFLTLSFAREKTSVLIEKKALDDIIHLLPKYIPNIRINHTKTQICLLANQKEFSIDIEIKIAKNENVSQKIKDIIKKIEDHCIYLLDSKPRNITINYVGFFEN